MHSESLSRLSLASVNVSATPPAYSPSSGPRLATTSSLWSSSVSSGDHLDNSSILLDSFADNTTLLVLSTPSYVTPPSPWTQNLQSAFETGDLDPLKSPLACMELVHCLSSLLDHISTTESTLSSRQQDHDPSRVDSCLDPLDSKSTSASPSPLDATMTQMTINKPQSRLDVVAKLQSHSTEFLTSLSIDSGTNEPVQCPHKLQKTRVLMVLASCRVFALYADRRAHV